MKKRYFLFSLLAVIFISCGKDIGDMTSSYVGIVVDASTQLPMSNIPVVVTDGSNIHTSVSTNADGRFEFIITISGIDGSYYILVGDETCIKKRVEIPGFANGETNLGTIQITGPNIPSVSLSGHRIDNGIITANGEVTEDGRLDVTERGFCYSTSSTPTIQDQVVACGNGKGWFSATINTKDLSVSSTYYFRPYATNSKGTAYGSSFSHTTGDGLPSVVSLGSSSVKATSASIGGRLDSNGGYSITERGVCWDTEGTPSIEKSHKYIDGNEYSNYWIDVDNLAPNTRYYARAYAKNINGVSYGMLVDFKTKEGIPTVETTQLKRGNTIIECYGNVSSDGGFSISRRGFCYSTHSSPSLNDNVVDYTPGTGEYMVSIDGLNEGTTYYVRAFAQNQQGIVYGGEKSILTYVLATFSVVDENGKGIPGATVRIGSDKFTCDNSGVKYVYAEPGSYNLYVSAPGYETAPTRTISINRANKSFKTVLKKTSA